MYFAFIVDMNIYKKFKSSTVNKYQAGVNFIFLLSFTQPDSGLLKVNTHVCSCVLYY